MRVYSRFNIVDRDKENNIVFIEDDFDIHGGLKTVTNDAENVVAYFRSIYGNGIRIVYRDTDMEWWEIDWILTLGGVEVNFKRWHGLVWDKLTKVDA